VRILNMIFSQRTLIYLETDSHNSILPFFFKYSRMLKSEVNITAIKAGVQNVYDMHTALKSLFRITQLCVSDSRGVVSVTVRIDMHQACR
jgi:hypothetical protein